nr:hypothetical protein [Tanacetum cinerariifolium]
MHKEDQQAASGPASLGATGEEGAKPQLTSVVSASLSKPVYSASFIIHSEFASGHNASASSNPSVLVDKIKSAGDGLKNTHTKTGTNLETSKAEKDVTFSEDEFNTSPGLSSSDDTKTEIKLENLSNLVLNLEVDFMDFDSLEDDQPIIVEDEEDSTVLNLTTQVAELKTLQWELPDEFLSVPCQVSSVQAKIKTLDVLPSLLNKVTEALDRFEQAVEHASQKAGDQGVPSAGQTGTHPVKGEKNTKQATITQLFKQKAKKDAEKANLNQSPKPTKPETTIRELIKKDEGKKSMSSKDAKEEGTKSESDEANLTGPIGESSKKKKIKKFDFVTNRGDHIHLIAEQIKEQKRIEESVKAELAKQEVELGKEELVNLLGIDVVKGFYKDKLQYFKLEGDHTAIVIQPPCYSAIKLSDLARKKRKHADDIHDYFMSTKKFKSSVQCKDHPAGTVLNEPCLVMIMYNSVQRQDFVTNEDFGDFSNKMMYTVQAIFFRLHQGLGLDDHARTFSSLLLAEVDKSNLNPLKQMRAIEQLRQ